MKINRQIHPKFNFPSEILIAVLIETAAVMLFFKEQLPLQRQVWILLGGTLLAVVALLSPAISFSPLRFRAYRSRLTYAEAEYSSSAGMGSMINTGGGAFIGGNVETGGGDFIGRDQVQISIHPTINIPPPAQSSERLVSWTVLLSGIISLLFVLVRIIVLAILFADLTILLLPILAVVIFLVTRIFHVDRGVLQRLAVTYLKIPSDLIKDLLAVFRPKMQALAEYGLVILLSLILLACVLGATALFKNRSTTASELAPKQLIFEMDWAEYTGYRAKEIQAGMRDEIDGKWDQAIEHYRMEIKNNPQNAAAYNNLAWIYAEHLETNLEEAAQLAETSVRLTEEEENSPYQGDWLGNHLDTLGWVYYKQGNYAKAIETLEKAQSLTSYFRYRAAISKHLEAARNALAAPEPP